MIAIHGVNARVVSEFSPAFNGAFPLLVGPAWVGRLISQKTVVAVVLNQYLVIGEYT